MIYTLTANPSLDYVLNLENFKPGSVNRTKKEKLIAGGKGINVSIVLTNLGVKNKALGFTAGFTGRKIQEILNKQKVTNSFIQLKNGDSRINVKLLSDSETDINANGPEISYKNLKKLFKKLDKLRKNDKLILAGSIPPSLQQNFYSEIMTRLKDKNIDFVVDATKDLLTKALEFKPFLIKPNIHELGEIFSKELSTKEEVIFYAKELQKMGAKNVLVSMGKDGAILLSNENKVYLGQVPPGETLINSVGSGDSMIAGFLTGYEISKNYETALQYGLCAGTASACSECLATKERVMELLKICPKININL